MGGVREKRGVNSCRKVVHSSECPLSEVPLYLPPPLQISWLNSYHASVRETAGSYLQENGKDAAYRWLLRETTPLG